MDTYEVVWHGRETLTDSLERDYADFKGEGWDLIWEPPSPLTTPWESLIEQRGALDPEAFIATPEPRQKNAALLRLKAHELRNDIARDDHAAVKELAYVSRRGPARKATRILREWLPEAEQHGATLTPGGHWRVSQRAMRPRKR